MVLQFTAGLLKSSLSTDIFIKLLPESTEKRPNLSSSEPKTLTSWPATQEDKDLAVQVCKCLYEINDEKQQPVLQDVKEVKKIANLICEFDFQFASSIDLFVVLLKLCMRNNC